MMKRRIALILALVLAAAAVPALAQELKFTRRDFYGGQTLPVYYGPGREYERGANGWAKCSTDETVYAAGRENGWALVMYYTSGGSSRVGYVDLSQFRYDTGILKLRPLDFSYSDVTITRPCILTDDVTRMERELLAFTGGESVTYLASFEKHGTLAYIETWMDGHPVRGFVPMECVSWE